MEMQFIKKNWEEEERKAYDSTIGGGAGCHMHPESRFLVRSKLKPTEYFILTSRYKIQIHLQVASTISAEGECVAHLNSIDYRVFYPAIFYTKVWNLLEKSHLFISWGKT